MAENQPKKQASTPLTGGAKKLQEYFEYLRTFNKTNKDGKQNPQEKEVAGGPLKKGEQRVVKELTFNVDDVLKNQDEDQAALAAAGAAAQLATDQGAEELEGPPQAADMESAGEIPPPTPEMEEPEAPETANDELTPEQRKKADTAHAASQERAKKQGKEGPKSFDDFHRDKEKESQGEKDKEQKEKESEKKDKTAPPQPPAPGQGQGQGQDETPADTAGQSAQSTGQEQAQQTPNAEDRVPESQPGESLPPPIGEQEAMGDEDEDEDGGDEGEPGEDEDESEEEDGQEQPTEEAPAETPNTQIPATEPTKTDEPQQTPTEPTESSDTIDKKEAEKDQGKQKSDDNITKGDKLRDEAGAQPQEPIKQMPESGEEQPKEPEPEQKTLDQDQQKDAANDLQQNKNQDKKNWGDRLKAGMGKKLDDTKNNAINNINDKFRGIKTLANLPKVIKLNRDISKKEKEIRDFDKKNKKLIKELTKKEKELKKLKSHLRSIKFWDIVHKIFAYSCLLTIFSGVTLMLVIGLEAMYGTKDELKDKIEKKEKEIKSNKDLNSMLGKRQKLQEEKNMLYRELYKTQNLINNQKQQEQQNQQAEQQQNQQPAQQSKAA